MPIVWLVEGGDRQVIVIRIELWPKGDEKLARTMGVGTIENIGTGSADRGNYRVRLSKFGGKGTWKRGYVRDFPRTRLGPWDLLFRALSAIVGHRNEPTTGASQ